MKVTRKSNHPGMLAAMLIFISCPSFAAFRDAGGWGVRPLGMAGAYTAIADDSNAPLYNPAGMPRVKQEELSLMSAQLYSGLEGVDITLNYLGYVHPMSKKIGSMGVAWGALSTPSLYREDTASLAYGRFINDVIKISQPNISLGAAVKYLKHEYTLDARTAPTRDPVFARGNSAAATTFDAGLIASWDKIGFAFAATCRNVTSPDVGLLTVDKVPLEKVLGFSYVNKKLPYVKLPYFTSAVDIISREKDTDVRVGLETLLINGKFAVRAGARQQDITFGLGYNIKIMSKLEVVVDYAFAWPLEIEKSSGSHRFGLSVRLP